MDQPQPDPTINEQIRALDIQIESIMDCSADLDGPTKGQISDPDMRHTLECLQATRRILAGLASPDQ